MNVVTERFLELCALIMYRPLTQHEEIELLESQQHILNQQWKVALLKNYSLMASMTNDTEWQFELCKQIESIEGR